MLHPDPCSRAHEFTLLLLAVRAADGPQLPPHQELPYASGTASPKENVELDNFILYFMSTRQGMF